MQPLWKRSIAITRCTFILSISLTVFLSRSLWLQVSLSPLTSDPDDPTPSFKTCILIHNKLGLACCHVWSMSFDLALSSQPEGFFLVKRSFFLLLLRVCSQGQALGSCESPRYITEYIRFYKNKFELNLIDLIFILCSSFLWRFWLVVCFVFFSIYDDYFGKIKSNKELLCAEWLLIVTVGFQHFKSINVMCGIYVINFFL